MKLNTRARGDEAIAKIVDATGKSLEYRDAPISSRAFKAEFPNAVSWTALHPTLLGGWDRYRGFRSRDRHSDCLGHVEQAISGSRLADI